MRNRLVQEAGYALWLLAVQREATGLNDITSVLRTYEVPIEVYNRMGPLAASRGPARTGSGDIRPASL